MSSRRLNMKFKFKDHQNVHQERKLNKKVKLKSLSSSRPKIIISSLIALFLFFILIFVIGKSFAVPETIISESGLPQGYNWSVTLGNVTKYSVNPQIIFIGNNSKLVKFNVPDLNNASNILNCTTFYIPINSSGYITTNTHNNIIKFTNYTVCKTTFIAVGKLDDINWSVYYIGTNPYKNQSGKNDFTMNNSTYGDTLTFITSPGNYSVGISYKLKNRTGLVSLNPYTNGYLNCKVFVNGTTNKEGCLNVPPYKLEAGKTYNVSFYLNLTLKESGLPVNTMWDINLNNETLSTNSSNITFSGTIGKTYSIKLHNIQNGSCIFNFYDQANFNITLENGANVIQIPFIYENCITKFIETGLPNETRWYIGYGMYSRNSSSNIIQINSSSEIGQKYLFSLETFTGTGYTTYTNTGMLSESSKGICLISYDPNITTNLISPGSVVLINFQNKTICNFPESGLLKTTILESGLSQSMLNDELLDIYYPFYSSVLGSTSLQFTSNGGVYAGGGSSTTYYPNGSASGTTITPSISYSGSDVYGDNITLYLSKGIYSFDLFGPTFSNTSFSNNSNLYTLAVPENNSINITAGSTAYLYYREASAWNLEPSPIQHTSNGGVSIPFNLFRITTFTENGLPNEAEWNVEYNGVNESSNSSQISFLDYNGTFDFFTPSVYLSGCLYKSDYYANYVSGGNYTVNFHKVCTNSSENTSKFLFVENGLPLKVFRFQIRIGNNLYNSTNNSLKILLPNSKYEFSVQTSYLNGIETNTNYSNNDCFTTYTANPSSGIASPNEEVIINFSNVEKCITQFVVGSGLPNGTNWNVTYNSITESQMTRTGGSTEGLLQFYTSPGEYNYTFPNIINYNGTCNVLYRPTNKSGVLSSPGNLLINYTSMGCK